MHILNRTQVVTYSFYLLRIKNDYKEISWCLTHKNSVGM